MPEDADKPPIPQRKVSSYAAGGVRVKVVALFPITSVITMVVGPFLVSHAINP